MSRSNNAVFVVFEGLDGSGKTTSAKRIAEMLGARYLTTPSGPLREHRELILEHFGDNQEAAHLLYLASVASASMEIQALLQAGQSVVLDRYLLSTQVYAEFRGSALDWSGNIAKILTPADLTVYLDAPLAVRHKRVKQRSAAVSTADAETLSEQADSALREGYKQRLNMRINGRILVLDSSLLDIDEIAIAVINALSKSEGDCK